MLEESLPFVLRRLRDRGVLSESQAQEALRGAAYVGRLPNILEACSELPAAADDALRGALAEDDADEMRLDYTLLDEGPCFVPNTKYMPANMPNEDRTVEENVLHCQSRCAKTAGCAHFTYWPNRGCHLQSMEARPQFASRVTAGPPDCREGFRMKTCFHENTKFEPVNMPGQRRTQVGSVLECQQRCRQTTGCEHFSLWPDGGCHIQDANASEVTARHIISGPRHRTKSYPMRIDETALAPLEDEETANDDDVDDGQRTLDEPESDVLGVASSDPESDLVPQPRAVALVLAASQYVVEGFLEAEDFEREVRGCNITTVKEAEFEQLRQMIKFLRREELCPSDEPHHPKVPDPLSTDCLVPDGPWEQRVLSRMAVIQRIKLEKEGAPSLQECHCPEPAGELLTSSKLLEVVENQDIARSPLMMRDAARQVCTEKGQDSGVSLAVVFNNACSVGKRGYCCEARDLRWSAVPLRLRGDELAEESLVHLMGLAESLRSDSEKIYWKFLRKLEDWKWLSNEQKVMFYKLYIIYYHHVRLAIERQQYCMLNPEDLTSCEDPMNLYFSIKVVRNEILQSHRALFEYGSCLQLGTRTIAATVRGRPVAAKVRGIAGILFRRAVHILGTGQIQRRVHRAALQLARSAWTHRFELILVSLVLGAGQPLMQALTATGVSTGAATSWTLILEQFMRNMFVHVGCPILSSPLLMAMLLRWSMNRIILTEFFINNAVQPLWEMAKKALEPVATFVQINKEVFRTSADVLKTIMRAVRLRQDPAQSVETNSTSDDRQSWIEAAREFHATAAADVFYAFLSVTFGAAWRALATAACTVAKLALPVVNGAEAGIDAAAGYTATAWQRLATAVSGLLKKGTNDVSLPFVKSMAAEDAKVKDAAKNIPSKTLAVVHTILGKGSLTMSTSIDKSLDLFAKVLDMIGQSTIFVYGLSSALSFAVLRVWQPGQGDFSSDQLMAASLSAKLDEVNADACRGKKPGSSCVFLQFAGFSNETVAHGVCCRGTCDVEPCTAGAEEVAAEQEFAVQNVSLGHLRRQSKFLYGFINLARKSYGGFCRDLDE